MKKTLLLAALLVLTCQCGRAGEPFSVKVGDSKLYLLQENEGRGNVSILVGASPEILTQYAPEGTFPNAVNVFLLKAGGKNILFDTGFGRELYGQLDKLKVKPGDIHAVYLTHMHGDHIGGMMREGAAAFPNAKVYISRAEFEYWTDEGIMMSQPERRRENFKKAREISAAYSGRTVLFDPGSPGEKSFSTPDGITAYAAYGHTPGHTVFLVESAGDKLLIWGDLAHAMAVQMPHPEVAVTYDVDPKAAVLSRLRVLEYASAGNIPVVGMHVPWPGGGKVQPRQNWGYDYTPFNYLPGK